MKINQNYTRFIFKLGIIILSIVFVDQIVGNILRFFYNKQVAGAYFRTTYSIDSTNAAVLVFGSSRANHHYVPGIFENGLNLDFYNTGRDGNFLLYNYAVFKSVTKRYSPKIIIFDINNNELDYNKTEYDRLSALLPYYKNHKEIRDVICLRGSFEKGKLLSAIYPFNSDILTIGIGNLESNKKRKGDYKGFVPLHTTMNDKEIKESVVLSNPIDTNKINALQNIIKTCTDKKIRLIFVRSPSYENTKSSSIDSILNDKSLKGKIEYFKYTNDSTFLNHPEYFADPEHLNEKGADVFSSSLVEKITTNN